MFGGYFGTRPTDHAGKNISGRVSPTRRNLAHLWGIRNIRMTGSRDTMGTDYAGSES